MRAGNIYQFKNLSKFHSVEEFNQHKERFMQHYPELFTRSEFIAFEVLSQYSVKVPGVANAKIDTLVSACSGKQGGVSRATFVRMLRKAKKAGILNVHKTYRCSGGFAHNVFVFQPFDISNETQLTHREERGTPCESRIENLDSAQESINLFSNLEIKDLNIRQEKDVQTQPSAFKPHIQDLDHTFVPVTVPKKFIDTVRPFFGEAIEIYSFWGKALLAHKKLNFHTPLEHMTSLVIVAFKTTVFHYKHRKIKTSFMQYYYGTLNGMLNTEKRREHTNRNRPDFNWIDA